ncbi:MAG: TIGR01777 family oxidoreductase [Opitutales bacterium]|nr:TIGR01777 family oxidoreductase [Opitutales bacterium]MCH8541003.1 TIGR01777 family oxidoreductase [Opitutales bacterium]
MKNEKIILVTGSSGLVGSQLVKALGEKGYEVRRLVRREPEEAGEFAWDPEEGEVDSAALEDLYGVIHLAGENIAEGRWSKEKKRRIWTSRETPTALLASRCRELSTPPQVFVSASATGLYGNREEEQVDEASSPGEGYLADLCRAWERAADQAEGKNTRVVKVRIGPVLSPSGGLLEKVLPIFRKGLGGKLGTGKQFMPWVSVDDLIRIFLFVLEKETLSGPVNAVSPEPVRNESFTKILGRLLHRPTFFPAPAFALRTAFGEMADEMLLGGAKVAPKVLLENGFEFHHPEIEKGLRWALKSE